MKIDTKYLIGNYLDEAIKATMELIKIPSVESSPIGDMPIWSWCSLSIRAHY